MDNQLPLKKRMFLKTKIQDMKPRAPKQVPGASGSKKMNDIHNKYDTLKETELEKTFRWNKMNGNTIA